MMLGIYGLFFELSNPGAFAPGVLGGICLLLALFAFQALPIDASGVLLILLGVVLLILEVKVTSLRRALASAAWPRWCSARCCCSTRPRRPGPGSA